MDRRRFQTAHLKYACLQMVARYPDDININCVRVDGDTTETLNGITPTLFRCFEARYAGWFNAYRDNFVRLIACIIATFNILPLL